MTPPLFWRRDLPSGPHVVLDGDEGRHAARVRRIGAGETVCVGDGAGTVLTCVVRAVAGDRLELDVTSRLVEPPPSPRFVVVQAVPKGERAEVAVELLTELGADEIVAWHSARTIGRWRSDGRTGAKWERTAAEAGKQSRRAWLPVIAAPEASVVPRVAGAALAVVLHEDAAEPLAALPVPPAGDVVVVVGPEGGVAPDELAELTAAGARAVRLGGPVLRTSSAGAAALAVLSAFSRWR